jgi:hypothetical protein
LLNSSGEEYSLDRIKIPRLDLNRAKNEKSILYASYYEGLREEPYTGKIFVGVVSNATET